METQYEYKRYCIQCEDTRSGVTGCFFYTRDDNGNRIATDTIHGDVAAFFAWATARGWGPAEKPGEYFLMRRPT